MSGITAADAFTSVLTKSGSCMSLSTDLWLYRFAFASPGLLQAGNVYLAAAVNAAGTTAVRTTAVASGSSEAWEPNAPGQSPWRTAQFDTIGLSIGQNPSNLGTDKYGITLEGTSG